MKTDLKKLAPYSPIIAIIGVIIAISVGFFGLDYTKVGSLVSKRPAGPPERDTFPPERDTFSWNLESRRAVESEGGTVQAPGTDNFVKGESACGTGFVSKEKSDVIIIPLKSEWKDPLTNITAGTVELCVTPLQDINKREDNLSFFRAPPIDGTLVSLKIVSIERKTPELRLRVKKNSGEKGSVKSTSILDWKSGEHHHIIGTWGAAGLHLYIDGEHVAGRTDFKGGPENLHGEFVINNTWHEDEPFKSPTHCIVSNVRISNYQWGAAEVKARFEELHPTE